jgi:hypothetical protein
MEGRSFNVPFKNDIPHIHVGGILFLQEQFSGAFWASKYKKFNLLTREIK